MFKLLIVINLFAIISNYQNVMGQQPQRQQQQQQELYQQQLSDDSITFPEQQEQYVNSIQRNSFLKNPSYTIPNPSYDPYNNNNNNNNNNNYNINNDNNKEIRERTPYDYVTEFSWKLFSNSKLPDPSGNLILSPILVQSLLSLLGTVATGETSEQIKYVVKEPNFDNTITKLITKMKNTQYRNEISFATAMFASQDLSFNDTFLREAIFRQIDMKPTDFANPRQASATVNNWVAQKTNNRIQTLFNPDSVQGGIRLLLANTIYFRGFWKSRFNKTAVEQFNLSNSRSKKVTMMKGQFKIRGDEFVLNSGLSGAWIELPYDGSEFSMVLILPNIAYSLDSFIRQMTSDDVLNLMGHLDEPYKRLVTLTLPKFNLRSSFSIVNTILKMGLVDLFTVNSKLTYLTSNNEFIRVDDILQQAVLNVDEDGSVAAAATSVAVVTLSISSVPEEMTFEVNQPFLALIIDKRNKVPLFIAKVYNP